MTEHTTPIEAPRERLFTFSSGGWHIVAAILVLVVVTYVTVMPIVESVRSRPPGDGLDPSAYQFALTPSLVPEGSIHPAMHHRDFTDPLVDPLVFSGRDVARWNQENRGKHLVSTDPVIGVVVNGAARAYPLLVLNAHEIINDVLGGEPILVMYNPLCRSASVFRRTIDGRVVEFGVSGLVYQSNLLIFDRNQAGDIGGESLWSQIQARALTGAAAERELTLEALPCQVMHWNDWLDRHPETTVLAPDERFRERWKKTTYDGYYANDVLNFPVVPMPEDVAAAKQQVLAVETGEGWQGFTFGQVVDAADESGTWMTEVDGRTVRFKYRRNPSVVWLEVEGDLPPTMYAAEFAWTALR